MVDLVAAEVVLVLPDREQVETGILHQLLRRRVITAQRTRPEVLAVVVVVFLLPQQTLMELQEPQIQLLDRL
jgi:hypothetical protein